jgi:hypothetical protein
VALLGKAFVRGHCLGRNRSEGGTQSPRLASVLWAWHTVRSQDAHSAWRPAELALAPPNSTRRLLSTITILRSLLAKPASYDQHHSGSRTCPISYCRQVPACTSYTSNLACLFNPLLILPYSQRHALSPFRLRAPYNRCASPNVNTQGGVKPSDATVMR